jgi:hypothetical protein
MAFLGVSQQGEFKNAIKNFSAGRCVFRTTGLPIAQRQSNSWYGEGVGASVVAEDDHALLPQHAGLQASEDMVPTTPDKPVICYF